MKLAARDSKLSVVSIADNIAQIRDRIAEAASRAGRDPASVELMAVSKTFPAEVIHQAHGAGLRLFGENYVQEFADKREHLPPGEYHLIGHLQSNKAAKAAELFDAIDSVDSLKLAERLNTAAAALGKTLPVLVEINIGGEDAKSGIAPYSDELWRLLEAAPRLPSLKIEGLMCIPPLGHDAEFSRPYFESLRELRDRVAGRDLPGVTVDVLSMGMSGDFEVAIEEGCTRIRVGTAIFGLRK